MDANILFTIFLILTRYWEGSNGQLTCYHCNSSDSCKIPTEEKCTYPAYNEKNNATPICLNREVTYHGTRQNESGPFRGCYLQDDYDPCEALKQRLDKENALLRACDACNTSFCNIVIDEQKKNDTGKVAAQELTCYSCHAEMVTNNTCEIKPKDVTKQNCTPGFLCGSWSFTDGVKDFIYRECIDQNKCSELEAEIEKSRFHYCRSCNTNLCNGAISKVFNVGFVFAVSALLFLVFI